MTFAFAWARPDFKVDDATIAKLAPQIIAEHRQFLWAGGRLTPEHWRDMDPRVRPLLATAGMLNAGIPIVEQDTTTRVHEPPQATSSGHDGWVNITDDDALKAVIDGARSEQ